MDDTEPVPQGDFGRKFLGGLSWSAAAQLGSQIVTFLAGVLLARLLAPAEFGVVAMALVYTTFVWILGQTGFNAAIVYLDDVSDVDLCTIYWANLGFNTALFGVAVALSPWVGRFFHNPQVAPIVAVASLGLIVSAVGGVQRTLLEKRLEFRRLAQNQFAASVVYAIVAVLMAFAGMGVWALVVGRVLEVAVDTALAIFTAGWSPKMRFSRASLERLFSYGSRVWAGNMLFYGQENIDNLIVGRMLGAVSLGYYSLAFRLANVPRWFFAGLVGRVMFPSFSSGRQQLSVLKNAYLRICSYSIVIGLGLGAGMALVAREFIAVVYGAKWLPSVMTLRVLAVAGGMYCIGQVTGPVLLAMGKPGLQTRLLFGSSSVLLAGALLGVRWGIAGVAFAVFAAVTLILVLGQYFVVQTLEIDWAEYRSAIAPPLEAIVSMALVVLLWQWVGRNVFHASDIALLVFSMFFGATGLLGTLVLRRAPQLTDIQALLRRSSARAAVTALDGEDSL